MALTLYFGSGSPFAWKAWLALEHKGVAYEARRVMFDEKELKSETFLAMNPRGKVPVLVDGDYPLYESSAIVEYLEDTVPTPSLLGETPKARSRTRRIAAEADSYLYPVQRELMAQTLFRPADKREDDAIERARVAILKELPHWERTLGSDPYFGGASPSLADYAAFPILRAIVRVEDREPALGLGDRTPAWMRSYLARMESLDMVQRTWPPHWR